MLKDTFRPLIAKNLTPSAMKTLEKEIVSYVDRNSEFLMVMELSRRFSFGDQDRDVLYRALGFTEDQLAGEVAKSKQIYSGNKIQSKPFYLATILAAGYFLDMKSKEGDKMANLVITYMSLNMWTSLHKGFFKYEANKQVMEYTLTHLNNTYSIRDFPSVFAFIQDNTATVLNAYADRIKRGTDQDLTWVIDSTWTRLKGKLKKISSEYYANHKAGNYLNSDTEEWTSDTYRELDNQSFATDRLANKVYIKLTNRQYDRRFIKYSITRSDTSLSKLTHLIEDIIDQDGEDQSMRKLISAMIELYLLQSGRPIQYVAKGDFIAFMQTAFGSNTDAPQMKAIKDIIDQWLAQNMYKYGSARYGTTVKITYRRCIYMFFVFIINYEAKLQ